jgi:hypothetical protein
MENKITGYTQYYRPSVSDDSASLAHQEELDIAQAIAASLQTQLSGVNDRLGKEVVAGRAKLAWLESVMTEKLEKLSEKMLELEQRERENFEKVKRGD